MRAYVDKELCIGCGYCVSCCPEVFRQDEKEKAEAYSDTTDATSDAVQDAIGGCPVCAISEEA